MTRKVLRWVLFSLAGLAALVLPATARAADVTVDCMGGPADFASVTAALNALDLQGPHTIAVTGTCMENVVISDRERIVLRSAPGQTATLVAANSSQPTVLIDRSRFIELRDMVIRGGTNGVTINNQSLAILRGCTVESSRLIGVQVLNGSLARMGGNAASQAVRVTQSGTHGINVSFGFLIIEGNTTIEDNAIAGIIVNAGTLNMTGNPGENFVRNNGFGVNITNASTVLFTGRNTIQNNGVLGIQAVDTSHLSLTAVTLPDGTSLATVVEGHPIVGINVARLSNASLTGRHQIRNNGGGATADPALRGGIRVSRGSLTTSGGAEITNNVGPGIRVEFNASVSLAQTTLSGNSEGVRVTRQSAAEWFAANSVFGNGNFGLTCDSTSLVFGDLTGVSPIQCMRIEREQGPPRPGEIQ